MNNTINRLIIIGNGFDLAHGMKTRYKDFVNGYLRQRINEHRGSKSPKKTEDKLMSIIPLCDTNKVFRDNLPPNYYTPSVEMLRDEYNDNLTPKQNLDKVRACRYEVQLSPFFDKIIEKIENKNWVDIEYAYYEYLCDICNKPELSKEEVSEKIDELNEEMKCITSELAKYLRKQDEEYKNMNDAEMIREIIRPLRSQEMAVSADKYWKEFVVQRENNSTYQGRTKYFRDNDFYVEPKYKSHDGTDVYKLFPEKVFLLNFNYTTYIEPKFRNILPNLRVGSFVKEQLVCHIHGNLNDKNSIIFGYGDDSDEMYKKLLDKNDNRFLENDKTVKYLGYARYRNFLGFIESAPFQVCIMGHSCGISDKTLLSTIFQHENCVSIKPYFYENGDNDDYYEIIRNISRCFDDKKLMRDRVVNKEYCEPLPQPGKKKNR